MKLWAWGAIAGVVAGVGVLTYVLDSDGIIDVRKFFGLNTFRDYKPLSPTDDNIAELRDRVLADMVHIPGGSFKFGNVPVPVILDGETRNELIYGPVVDADRAPITLDSFYISRFELTNRDFDLYAAATDQELRPDIAYGHERQGPYPAAIAYHQATGYCDWLSEITGQPFDLPSSEQWEYAARSGGRNVAYATQNGAYDYLGTLYTQTLDEQPNSTHLPDAFPPNPYGLYAMSSNLAEWAKDGWLDTNGFPLEDGADGDPAAQDRRIWRGSTFRSQASLNSIYMTGAAGPVERERWLEMFPNAAPMFTDGQEYAYFAADVGARCVVNVAAPPSKSGFGRDPGPVPDDFPAPFVPLPRR